MAPTAEDEPCIAILFLAHDGVANPEVWETWREASNGRFADRIRFFVFRNERLKFSNSFADTHDLGLRIPTSWCSSTVPRALLTCMRTILSGDPQGRIKIAYIVSGRDLPLQPPETFFTSFSVTTEGRKYFVEPFKSIICQADDSVRDAMTHRDHWKPEHNHIRRKVICHNTFMALSRQHMDHLATFEDMYREDFNTIMELGDSKLLITYACAEEWLLGTMLRLIGLDKKTFTDWPLTDQNREKMDDPSPITWHSYEAEKRNIQWTKDDSRDMTLREAMLCAKQHGHLFFRKVGPLKPPEITRVAQGMFGVSARAVKKASGNRQVAAARTDGIEEVARALWTEKSYSLRARASNCDGDNNGTCRRERMEELTRGLR